MMTTSREPDYELRNWQFYWPEMKQYNIALQRWYDIRLMFGKIEYNESGWTPYTQPANKTIADAYQDYIVEQIILGDTADA